VKERGARGEGGGRKIDVSNESHFSTSGGKRRKRERDREKKHEATSQVFRAVIDSYPENKFHCRNVDCKWN
jgi:hypothetical protein